MSNYVVIDLEMCRLLGEAGKQVPGLKNELIQIGAALVDENNEMTDTFMTYVAPQYGYIDPFIENLTGITEGDVKNAPDIEDALRRLIRWMPEESVLLSWSNSDKKHIDKELTAKNIHIGELDPYMKTWTDCQRLFGDRMDTRKRYKLSEALIIADIDVAAGEHDALIDAVNTAKLYIKMSREPEMTLNEYYTAENDVSGLTYNPFAELLKNVDKDRD